MTPTLLVDRSHPRSAIAVCATCGVGLRFFSEIRYGRSMQECACGVQVLQVFADVPVHIPASMVTDDRMVPVPRAYRTCPVCGRTYVARAKDGAEACSAKCRRVLDKGRT
jgi:hypothetical protein